MTPEGKMNYVQAEKMLKSCGQEHVLAYWKKLSKKEQGGLLEQIATIEPKSVKMCASALKKLLHPLSTSTSPVRPRRSRN